MEIPLNREAAEALEVAAASAFSPRTPISTKALFAGRWNQLTLIGDTVGQVGLHAVVFGERGVGKTSLTHVIRPVLTFLDREAQKTDQPASRIVVRVNAHGADTFSSLCKKALDEVLWMENKPTLVMAAPLQVRAVPILEAMGITDELSIDDVRRALVRLPGSVFIFDEFDRLPRRFASSFTDLIKGLSDGAIQSTVVLVGVAETVEGLMRDHASIGRALVQIPMPRMNEAELSEIIGNAEKALGIAFDVEAKAQIVRMSQGLPHFTHLLGLHAVRAAARRLSGTVTVIDVKAAFQRAVSESDQTVSSAYKNATHSAQPGAKYPQVLLAAAIAAYVSSDDLGYFQPASLVGPMSTILGREEEIAGFNQHLSQFMEDKRGRVLERDGQPRAYRYRFSQPLLPPYVIMRSINDHLVTLEQVNRMLQEPEG